MSTTGTSTKRKSVDSAALPHHSEGRRWADLTQAADAFPVFSRRTIERMIQDRELPFYRVRGRLLVDLNDLEALIASTRHEAVS